MEVQLHELRTPNSSGGGNAVYIARGPVYFLHKDRKVVVDDYQLRLQRLHNPQFK